MNSGRKVLMVGLDSCDPALAQAFAAEGIMPNLAKMLETSARAPVRNPFGLFAGAVWVNFGTALKPETHGSHCWNKIEVDTYKYNTNRTSIDHLTSFWVQISDRGKRVAVVDVPHMIANRPVDGFQLFEWGSHDRHHGLHSYPPQMAKAVEARFGLHPALKGDPVYGASHNSGDDWVHRKGPIRTGDEECALLRDLLAGAERKREMLLALMDEEDWDLFLGVFSEPHSCGHQQWHLHDPRHPRHDPDVVREMGGSPLTQVYAAVDKALGDIVERAPDDALVLTYLSHGMGPQYDGDYLLEQILVRLDRHGRGEPLAAPQSPVSVARRALRKVARILPAPLRARIMHRLALRPTDEELRARRRFFKEPNNTVYGGVRLNLVGREPRGIVHPHQVDALVEEISQGLLELVNVETGKPVVRSVERSEHWHTRSPADTMPDLFVNWERSALIETVSSPKIGTIHVPYSGWRTGDHRPAGLLLAKGRGFKAGARMPELAPEDIGPTIAAVLGTELRDVDGKVAEWLAVAGREGDPAPVA